MVGLGQLVGIVYSNLKERQNIPLTEDSLVKSYVQWAPETTWSILDEITGINRQSTDTEKTDAGSQ